MKLIFLYFCKVLLFVFIIFLISSYFDGFDGTRQISEDRTGSSVSEYQKQPISEDRTGSSVSEDQKQIINEDRTGSSISENQKQLISEDKVKSFSPGVLKQMGEYLSSFTELGITDFNIEDNTNESVAVGIIRFAIWHNYVNNSKLIAKCKVKNCKWGPLTIRRKYVADTIKKFLGLNHANLAGYKQPDAPYHYDGKLYHFKGAARESVYYARVDEATQGASGRIVMAGELYNVKDKSDILGRFEAVAKPHKYGRKNTWAIISIKTEFRTGVQRSTMSWDKVSGDLKKIMSEDKKESLISDDQKQRELSSGDKSKTVGSVDTRHLLSDDKSKSVSSVDTRQLSSGDKSKAVGSVDTRQLLSGDKSKTVGSVDKRHLLSDDKSKSVGSVDIRQIISEDKTKGFSSKDLKQMGEFLSNFTELGFLEFDMEEFESKERAAGLIQFGIWHNYVNNSKLTVKCKVKNCKWGSLTINGKHVSETIKRFFGVNHADLTRIEQLDTPYHYDGKLYHFEAAPGGAKYYARVDEASFDKSGHIVMTGELYNAEDKDDILGKFEAVAKPHKYGKVNTWAIICIKTEY